MSFRVIRQLAETRNRLDTNNYIAEFVNIIKSKGFLAPITGLGMTEKKNLF